MSTPSPPAGPWAFSRLWSGNVVGVPQPFTGEDGLVVCEPRQLTKPSAP